VPAHTSRATASDRVAVEGSERRACERKEPAGHFNVHGDDATTFLELTADASSAWTTTHGWIRMAQALDRPLQWSEWLGCTYHGGGEALRTACETKSETKSYASTEENSAV